MSADISRDEQTRNLAAAFSDAADRFTQIDGDVPSALRQLAYAEAHAGKLVKAAVELQVFPWLKCEFPPRPDGIGEATYWAEFWRGFVVELSKAAPSVPVNPLVLLRNDSTPGKEFIDPRDWRLRAQNFATICRQSARKVLGVLNQRTPTSPSEKKALRIERVRELCREHSLNGQWAKLRDIANADAAIVSLELDELTNEAVRKMCTPRTRKRGKTGGKVKRGFPRQ